MQVNSWQEIEDLFHSALQVKTEERAAYLVEACAGNEALRVEVESLVKAFEKERGFMEQPTLDLGLQILSNDAPAGSLVGRTIGQYKIERLLGRGGMGEVYLAEDGTLGRRVALKFLRNKFVDDDWMKSQLVKEARAVAVLEHPNICAVYGIEEADGHHFIVMQLVEGKTLDSAIHDEPFEINRVLDLAEQIAGALSSAHAHGIIHRDIKPQNIVVTASGQVKVLDFGLAKVVQQKQDMEGAVDNQSQISKLGLIVGTVGYMSPEQLRAGKLDYCSDIFSFGTLLYEMLSGVNPFKRESEAETISAILTTQPRPLSEVAPDMPRKLERIVTRCLEKKCGERYQSVDELLEDMRSLRKEGKLQLTPRRTRRFSKNVRAFSRYYAAASLALILLLVIGAAFTYLKMTRVRTLAVLPFSNESSDTNIDYLSEGLTQSLTDKLSHLSKLKVKPPTAVSAYKNQNVDPLQAGRELNVETVLTGKITTQDGAPLLRVSLLDTTNGSKLWEGAYTIKMAEILIMQDGILRSVTSALGLWLSSDEKRLLTTHQTNNTEAVRLYMYGRYYWGKRDENNIKEAIRYFEEAKARDPGYAQARAGLADAYMMLSLVSYGAERTKDAMMLARAAANEAIGIDPTLAEAHTSLAIFKLKYDWRWQDSEAEFKKAIELNPDYAAAHYWYSYLLLVQGRFDEALRESEINRELDPFSPHSTLHVGRVFYFKRQFDRAIEYFNKILEKNPDDLSALYLIALANLQKGMYPEAIAMLERIYREKPLFAAAALGYAYGKTGKRAEAFGVLKNLDELSRTQQAYVPPQERAIIYIGLKDKDKALMYLEEAYNERFAMLPYIATEPLFDDLRSDPRFINLEARINLAP